MSVQERLRRRLVEARRASERYLQDFQTAEAWTRQLHETANHALWFAGHMGNTDNFFISILASERARDLPEFSAAFGMGSTPTADIGAYPPVEEVLAYMRERRQVLLELLDGMRDEDFARPTPAGAPEFLADVGAVFEMAIWHEGLHAGQLSVIRRSLGFGPAFA